MTNHRSPESSVVVRRHLHRRQSLHQQSTSHGWRQNSLTITALAEQTAYFTEKTLQNEADADIPSAPPVSYYRLFRFMTPGEFFTLLLGSILACINALFVPLGVILYGEFIALLIARTVMTGTSTTTIAISLFGGGKILTNGTRAQNREALIQDSKAFGIGCIVFSMIQFLAAALSVNFFNNVALRQIQRVKKNFLQAVLRQDIAWYDLNTTMNFATKVSDDVDKFREAIGEKVPMLIYLVMSFVLAVIISFVYGWELTLVILSCTPVIIATTALVAKLQSSLTEKELKAYSAAGMLAEEVLSSIRTVVAFGGEEKEIQRYSNKLTPAKKFGNQKGIYAGLGTGVMWLIIYATYAISFWYGVGLILDSRREETPLYNPATLMIIFFSVLQGALNVGLTSPHLEAMAVGRASAAAIYQVIDRKPVIDSLSKEGSMPELQGDIQLIDVMFKYPARPGVQVLNRLNLEILKNETVALVGPSGCGKSTVLQLIQRMYDPDKGEVLASGHDLRNLNVKYLRMQIGVVGQEPVLFAGTIKDNIRIGNPRCTDEDIVKAAREAYCHKFITHLPQGYKTVIGERGDQLSGGQKQRIAIARALVRKPKLLILDEATSALDSQSEAQVQRALDAVAKTRTTVMVSHRLSTVLNADRIVFIDKGQVVEQGTHEELLGMKGYYYQLVLENEPSIAHKEEVSVSLQDLSRRGSKRRSHSQALVVDEGSIESIPHIEDTEKNGRRIIAKQEEEKEFIPTTWQILMLCKPEKYLMLVGVIAAIIAGSSFPIFAVLFGETYGLLESPNENYVRGETNIIALLFLLEGVIAGVAVFTQIFVFNLTGVRLTARLRHSIYI